MGASDYIRRFFYDDASQLIGEYRYNPDETYAYVDNISLNGGPLVQEERTYNGSSVRHGPYTNHRLAKGLNRPGIPGDPEP